MTEKNLFQTLVTNIKPSFLGCGVIHNQDMLQDIKCGQD